MDTTNHNITNINKKNFSQQHIELLSHLPKNTPSNQIDHKMNIKHITQLHNPFLDVLFHKQNPKLSSTKLQTEFFGHIKNIFLEPKPNKLNKQINHFFDSLNKLTNNIKQIPIQQNIINKTQTLTTLFQKTTTQLNTLHTNTNQKLINFIPQINSLTKHITKLNNQINTSKITNQPTNNLHDNKNLLLNELSKLMNITMHKHSNKQLNILITNNSLVNNNSTHSIETITNPTLDPKHNNLIEIQFINNDSLINTQNNKLFTTQKIHNINIITIDTHINQITTTIIKQINLIHNSTNNIQNYS